MAGKFSRNRARGCLSRNDAVEAVQGSGDASSPQGECAASGAAYRHTKPFARWDRRRGRRHHSQATRRRCYSRADGIVPAENLILFSNPRNGLGSHNYFNEPGGDLPGLEGLDSLRLNSAVSPSTFFRHSGHIPWVL